MTHTGADKQAAGGSDAPRRAWVPWLLVLALAVVARLLYWWEFSSSPLAAVAVGADVIEYDRWAREILVDGLLWDRLHIHAPGYPLFLALLYRLTGVRLLWVRLLQLGVDVAALGAAAWGVRLLFGRRAGLCTAALWAVYQPLIYISAEVFSEGLMVLLLSLQLLCFAIAVRYRGRAPWVSLSAAAMAGLAGGLAAVTHPLCLVAALVPVGCLPAVARPPGASVWRRVVPAVAALALLALPVGLVSSRNSTVAGEPVFVQARSGFNAYLGNHRDATGTCYLRPGPAYTELAEWPIREGAAGPRAESRFFLRKAWEAIAADPLRWGGLVVRKALWTWNLREIPSGPDLPELRYSTRFMRVPLLRFGPLAALAALAAGLRRRRSLVLPLVTVCVGHTAVLALLVTSARYRLALVPALLALGGIGVDAAWHRWRLGLGGWVKTALVPALAAAVVCTVPRPPAIDSSLRESCALLAEAAWKTEDLETAETMVLTGLAAAPNDPELLNLAANVLDDRGDTESARRFLQRAAANGTADVRTLTALGVACAAAGDHDDAGAWFRKAAAAAPEDPRPWYNLAVQYERENETVAAEQHYRRALAGDPTFASAHLNLGILLYRDGRRDDALSSYRSALALRPRDPKALAGIAVYWADRDRPREAARFFRRALAADPGNTALEQALARVQTMMTQPQESPGK